MADDVGVNPTASYTVAADVIGTIAYQRVKVNIGSDGTVSDVDVTNPLPVTGTVQVSVSVAVSTEVSGTVSVIGPVQISGTVTAGAGTTVISGTVTVNVSGIVPVTTAASVSVSGIPVWLNPTQPVVVNTIGAGFSVNALVTGAVSISAMPAVSGTVTVNVSGIAPVTTAASVSVSGVPVWLNPTQAVVVNTIAAGFSVNALVTGVVSVSVMPAVSISVSAVLGTVITVLGTLAVSQTTVVSGTVAISIPASQTVGTIIAVSGVTAVSNVSTVVTVLGTVMVQPNFSTTATPSAAGTGQVIWVANTGAIMTTTGVSGSTGPVVWLGASQTIGLNPGLPLLIMVSSTAGAISMTTYLMTIWTGGIQVTAGATQFAVPAGQRWIIDNIQAVINSSAVTGGTVQIAVVGATASASLTSGSVPTQPHYQVLQMLVSAGPLAASIMGAQAAIIAATTMAVVAQGSTSYNIQAIVVQGQIY